MPIIDLVFLDIVQSQQRGVQFTEPGIQFANYGEEGVAFEYNENHEPVYTDFIIHNPDGYNPMNFRNMYTNPVFNNYGNATSIFYTYSEVELDAFDVWNNNGTSDKSLPTLNLTTDENAAYAGVATTVYTYATEQILKWMIGEEPLDDAGWNAYVDQLYGYGLQDCMDVYQNAYDEFRAGIR